MTHQLRLLILVVLVSMLWTSGRAQDDQGYNKFSIEVSGGIHFPMSPTEGINTSDYIGFQQFQASVRYMLNKKYGLRVYYAVNRFDGGDVGTGEYEGEDLFNTFNRIGGEAVVNLGSLFNMSQRFLDNNNLLFHGGAGLTFSSPATTSNVDRMGNITVGLTPQRKVSKRVAVFADVSYVANFKQHTRYNGIPFDNKEYVVGGFATVSIGLTVYLGSEKEHADWY